VYLRHSPGDTQTLDSQVEGMQKWCGENGWIVDRVFSDEAVEGSREDREQFQEMIVLARQDIKHADGIAVWSFSRFARDQLDAQFYKAELRKRGYVIVSKIDDIPTGEMAPIYEAFIDWKNQRFLDDLSADVKRG
jgi:site-specific DNA recombinase